jgi:hypothetical protein
MTNTENYSQDLEIAAPFNFLGATVLSFNASLGLAMQPSSLTVQTVIDCENNDYFGPLLADTDPRYNKVGDPVYLKITDPKDANKTVFEFGGVLTSWTANKSSSGLSYTIKIDDPRVIFDNVAIIVDTFNDITNRGGNTIGDSIVGLQNIDIKHNYINIYQYYEGLVNNGTCSVFGTSFTTSNGGMPYNAITQALREINTFIYTSTGGKFAVKWKDLIDFSGTIPNYFRIKGPKITLTDLISSIADIMGCEYYTYLEKIGDDNVIRIGFISLIDNPTSFLTLIENFDQAGIATDLSYGQELRTEKTKTILVGDNVHTMYYFNKSLPFFGFDDLNPSEPIIPYAYDSYGFWINIRCLKLNLSLNTPLSGDLLSMSEMDIRASMASFDAWLDRVMDSTIPGTFNQAVRLQFSECVNNGDTRIYLDAFNTGGTLNGIIGTSFARAFVDVMQNPQKYKVEAAKPDALLGLEIIHQYVANLGSTYYGKKFVVPLASNVLGDNPLGWKSVVCMYRNTLDSITGEWVFSAEPSSEGAWVDLNVFVLGLGDPYLELFRNEDGRLNGFAKFTSADCGKLDLTQLSDDQAVVTQDTSAAWVRFDVDAKIVMVSTTANTYLDSFITSAGLSEKPTSVPHAVITFSSPCYAAICAGNTQYAERALAWLQTTQAIAEANINGNEAPHQGMNLFAVQKTRTQTIDAQSAVDWSSINDRGWQPTIAYPSEIAIPFKINTQVYGPWGSSNCFNDDGGVEFQQETDLNPWTYGSVANMTTVGNQLVANMNRGLLRSETGSATIVGLPSLGNLGSVLGGGANITNISFSYGSNGISSTYEFRTYTPKFGKLSKLFIDRFKEYSAQRIKFLKLIKNNMISMNKIGKQIKNLSSIQNRAVNSPAARTASCSRVLIAEINDHYDGPNDPIYGSTYSQRTVTGLTTMHKSYNEMIENYDQKAYLSFDALFGPVSINGDGDLPQFANITNNGQDMKPKPGRDVLGPNDPAIPSPDGSIGKGVHFSSSEHINPPSYSPLAGAVNTWIPGLKGGANNSIPYSYGENPIYSTKLNPLSNPAQQELKENVGNANFKGHAIDIVGRDTTVPDKGLINNLYTQNDITKYPTDYRFLSLRGPLVLQAWGYDTTGKPIPNESDINAKRNTYELTGRKDRFYPDWLQKPNTWPVGPIDLRFDIKRGVWTTPPPFRIVVAKLSEDLVPHNTAVAEIQNGDKEGPSPVNAEGQTIPNSKIIIKDSLGVFTPVNRLVYAYFDTYDNRYIILAAATG